MNVQNSNMNNKSNTTVKKILLVDDEQFVLDGLNRLLREYRHEWQFELALNGPQALEILQNEDIAMVITDVRMPQMSGLELLEKIQDDPETRHIPVVILTGDHDVSLKRQALDLGAVDLLNKPICKEDMVSRIRNVLKIREYQDLLTEKNRELERQLVMSQKMELVGVMAAGAAHDVSNLLSVIVGYSSLFIEENVLAEETTVGLEKIKRAGEKASTVISRLLNFSRMNANMTVINMADLIEDILSILTVKIPMDIAVKWEAPDDPIFIEANVIALQQMIMNLCINAVQAIPDEGTITIDLYRNGNRGLCLEISDTGVGMDEQTAKNIFNPLFTTKEKGKGTGLGLFVVKHIVEEHSGKIDVRSTPGAGTCFTVFLPIDGDPSPEE